MTFLSAVFHGAGKPLELRENPVPDPAEGELLVRVRACTLCRSDLHTYFGRRQEPTPLVLGHEVVGQIEAFGPKTSTRDARGNEARMGDRITWPIAVGCGSCRRCQNQLPQKCDRLIKYGHQAIDPHRPRGGGLAEFMLLAPKTAWSIVPSLVPDELAALANCATATAVAVVNRAGLVGGKNVLILGAGVIGQTVSALVHAKGARLIAVADAVPENNHRACSFGAQQTFDARSTTISRDIQDATGGEGFDVAMELAGSSELARVGLENLGIGGRLVLAGTVLPTPPIALAPEMVVRKCISIVGVHNYHPDDLLAAFDFLAGPGQAYPFASMIDRTFPLAHVEEAFAYAEAQPGRRVVVKP